MHTITSRQHPLVQRCRAIARRRDGAAADVLLDGLHLVAEALAAGVPISHALIGQRLFRHGTAAALVTGLERAGVDLFEAPDAVADAASPVRTPTGIVAIAQVRPVALAVALEAPGASPPTPLVAGVVDVQDPGNVGAIVRAAEAAGATGVVVCGTSADPFGWKALRGSMGSVFRLPVAVLPDLDEVILAAKTAGLCVLAASPGGGRTLYELDLARPLMVLMGGEGGGLTDSAMSAADDRIRIPMHPPIDSLNVAVAAGVILFEAHRQRRQPGPS